MKIDEKALEAACQEFKEHLYIPGTTSEDERIAIKAAIEAYEAAKWRPIEEAPHQQQVLTLWQSGLQQVMYKTEYCPPLASTWRFANGPGSGQQGPWPVMFRTIDPPPKP